MTKERVITARGPRVRFSVRRHLLPPLAGLVLMAGVFAALNLQWLVAQLTYTSTARKQVSVAQVQASPAPAPTGPPELQIPAINVAAPLIFTERTDEGSVQLGLRNGVVHYASTARPGQRGNTVIFGHSSGLAWAPGNYKFVFTLLEKLKAGDLITVNYQGTRYIYRVTGSRVVAPTDTGVLASSDTPKVSLITCTPVGTTRNRLVVEAEQISPDPETATSFSAPKGRSGNLQALPQ